MNKRTKIVNTITENDLGYAAMNNGTNPEADQILAAMNLTGGVRRFRDAGFDITTGEIWIIARSGITNATGADNEHLLFHPLFLREVNDTYDPTYCYYFFKIPERHGFTHVKTPVIEELGKASEQRIKHNRMNEFEKQYMQQLLAPILKAIKEDQ